MAKISEQAKKFIEYLDCPCEVIPAGTEISSIMNIYDDLYAKRDIGGYTPMIFGFDGYFGVWDEWQARGEYQKEVLSEKPIIPAEWFRQRIKENREFYTAEEWEKNIGAVGGGDENRIFGGLMDYDTTKPVGGVLVGAVRRVERMADKRRNYVYSKILVRETRRDTCGNDARHS